jgi:hypothetical protein
MVGYLNFVSMGFWMRRENGTIIIFPLDIGVAAVGGFEESGNPWENGTAFA